MKAAAAARVTKLPARKVPARTEGCEQVAAWGQFASKRSDDKNRDEYREEQAGFLCGLPGSGSAMRSQRRRERTLPINMAANKIT
jgi:hypothetical protein